jgi:hypothetical protein
MNNQDIKPVKNDDWGYGANGCDGIIKDASGNCLFGTTLENHGTACWNPCFSMNQDIKPSSINQLNNKSVTQQKYSSLQNSWSVKNIYTLN